MNWFEQIFITFSLVLGTVVGESLVIKAFGRPKKDMTKQKKVETLK